MCALYRVQLFCSVLHPLTATFHFCSCISKRYLDTPRSAWKFSQFNWCSWLKHVEEYIQKYHATYKNTNVLSSADFEGVSLSIFCKFRPW
jgi:hypothetical protein